MLFGALLAILGVGMIFFEYFHRERIERGSFLRNLFYPWVAFQFLIGIVFGIGTLFFEMYHKEDFEVLEHISGRA
jgi:hypothetical protein